MANLNVTYEELNTVATKLTTGQGDLETKLSELKKLVDNLIAEGFVTDQSSGAFGTAYDDFNTGITKTVSGLEGMSSFLTKTASAFGKTDEELASALKG